MWTLNTGEGLRPLRYLERNWFGSEEGIRLLKEHRG